jgi:glycosyltransferase involved in cell wall biosynthesis
METDEMTKLTALITAYNQRQYIEEAVESVLRQECSFAFDVVIGDDGSDDGTWELLNEKYAHADHVKLIRMDRTAQTDNVGATRASRIRLELLKHVTGEYFCFLDGDDFYNDLHKFQKHVDVMDKPENSKYIVCASNMALYTEGENRSVKPICTYGTKPTEIDRKLCWKKVFFHANACVFRSALIPKLQPELLDYIYNDHMIFLSAIAHGDVYYIPDVTMYYRQNMNGSIWTSGSKLVGTVRGVMMIDMGDRICPDLKKENHYRYRSALYELYQNRNSIDKEKIDYWIRLAHKLGCKEVLLLTEYQDYPMLKKCLVACRFGCIKLKYEIPRSLDKMKDRVVGLAGCVIRKMRKVLGRG